MSPVIDVPGGDSTNAGHKHENVDEQEDEIEIVECFHAPRFSKIRASPTGRRRDIDCAVSITGHMRPIIYGYQYVNGRSAVGG
jgi:hypothetical protein